MGRTTITDFTEAERNIVQGVYRDGVENSAPGAIALYTEWECALAYEKALSDARNTAVVEAIASSQEANTAMAEQAAQAMEALKTSAIARLERVRNGKA